MYHYLVKIVKIVKMVKTYGWMWKSVWVLTVVESIILLQSWTVSTRCPSESPFQVSVVSS